jgi:hypothetical protein
MPWRLAPWALICMSITWVFVIRQKRITSRFLSADLIPIDIFEVFSSFKSLIVLGTNLPNEIFVLAYQFRWRCVISGARLKIRFTIAAKLRIFRPTSPTKKCPKKTYNSRYSLVVTHPTTNLPIYSLNMGERTGSLVLCSLWSYVKAFVVFINI